MYRVIATTVAAALVLTACTTGATAPAPTSAADDSAGVLEVLRSIDRCALFGDATSLAGHDLTVLGPSSPLDCTAEMGDVDGSVSIGLNNTTADAQAEEWIRHLTIDGVEVTSASSFDAPNAPPRDQVVSASCSFAARYPDRAALMVQISAPPEVDSCAAGDELIRTAIREYADKPQRDRDSLTTVLSGANPCAVADRLAQTHRVEIAEAETGVTSCTFAIDDSALITVFLAYSDTSLLEFSEDRYVLDGHRVAGDPSAGSYDVVVGDEFLHGDDTLIPVVTVVDPSGNTERIRLVAQAIADEY